MLHNNALTFSGIDALRATGIEVEAEDQHDPDDLNYLHGIPAQDEDHLVDEFDDPDSWE